MSGSNLTKMYPAGAPPDKELADKWTWDFFLAAAEKCHKAGFPFGLAMGVTNDAVNWVDPVFRSHGAALVDRDGNITVNSDATRQVLTWFKKLVPFLPDGVFAWDDSSNNKALISGQAALILNPPSAWAVGGARQPEGCRIVLAFSLAEGAEGTLRCGGTVLLGHLEILAKQNGLKEPDRLSVPALLGRADGRREQRL